jgi:hypothetical protein
MDNDAAWTHLRTMMNAHIPESEHGTFIQAMVTIQEAARNQERQRVSADLSAHEHGDDYTQPEHRDEYERGYADAMSEARQVATNGVASRLV